MTNLIRAEFRKILSVKVWWGLLIPTVVLALASSLTTGAFGNAFIDLTNQSAFQDLDSLLNIDPSHWKVSVFGIARSINIATIFPMVFGGLAISSEVNKKTITTTFLTAPSRVAALGAKLVTYLVWGVLYGVVIVLVVAVGTTLSSHPESLPDTGQLLELCAVGVVETVLATLFGVGIGALVTSVVGVTLLLTLYMLIGENVIVDLMGRSAPRLGGVLPNGSADGITGSIASDIFLNGTNVTGRGRDLAEIVAGSYGAFDWWLSALIFLGWTALAFGGGWLVSQKRDIT